MFTSLFVAPFWFWFTLFVTAILVPILIHLINLLRYQRVRWAAMEFLLKGIRRKRKSLRLKQILLVSARIGLLVLAIILFAGISFQGNQTNRLVPGMLHVVVVDDSYSMAQVQNREAPDGATVYKRNQDKLLPNCYDNAKRSILSLATQLAGQPDQKMLLIKTSSTITEPNSVQIVECDSNIETYINNFFADSVSDKAISPYTWIAENLDRLPTAYSLYLLTDVREKDLELEQTQRSLQLVKAKFSKFNLVTCSNADVSNTNLALTKLVPEHSLMSAGVPTYLTIEVTNLSPQVSRNVQVRLRKTTAISAINRFSFVDESDVLFPEIQAGESARVQVPVLVNQSGQVIFEAVLPEDSLEHDNKIHLVVDIPVANQVLLIADTDSQAVRYLSWMFEPRFQGSLAVNSGFRSEVQTPSAIADQNFNLDNYPVAFWLSDDLSNATAIKRIESFVQKGGLLFYFPGPFADPQTINSRLYRNDKGLISFPIDSAVDLPERNEVQKSDVQFRDPRLTNLFDGDSRKLLNEVQIYKKFIPPRSWNPEDTSTTTVLATARGRQNTPLILESKNGSGRVISFLIPVDDEWTNWATNPTFLVLIYQLIFGYQPYTEPFQRTPGMMVTEQIENVFAFENSMAPTSIRQATTFDNWKLSEPISVADLKGHSLSRRGVYQVARGNQAYYFAINPDVRESDLEITSPTRLTKILQLPDETLLKWDALGLKTDQESHSTRLPWWLFLVALAGLEQYLAYSLGFHANSSQAFIDRTGSGSSSQRRRHG